MLVIITIVPVIGGQLDTKRARLLKRKKMMSGVMELKVLTMINTFRKIFYKDQYGVGICRD